jgi:hypothetical protein
VGLGLCPGKNTLAHAANHIYQPAYRVFTSAATSKPNITENSLSDKSGKSTVLVGTITKLVDG